MGFPNEYIIKIYLSIGEIVILFLVFIPISTPIMINDNSNILIVNLLQKH